jgi:hypothetical protein
MLQSNLGATATEDFAKCMATLTGELRNAGFTFATGSATHRELWTAAALILDEEAANYLFGKFGNLQPTADKAIAIRSAACASLRDALAQKTPAQLAALRVKQLDQLAVTADLAPGQTPVALRRVPIPTGVMVGMGLGLAMLGVGVFFGRRA